MSSKYGWLRFFLYDTGFLRTSLPNRNVETSWVCCLLAHVHMLSNAHDVFLPKILQRWNLFLRKSNLETRETHNEHPSRFMIVYVLCRLNSSVARISLQFFLLLFLRNWSRTVPLTPSKEWTRWLACTRSRTESDPKPNTFTPTTSSRSWTGSRTPLTTSKPVSCEGGANRAVWLLWAQISRGCSVGVLGQIN